MMYLKLSIRNARRSFINYLLYVVTMTVLLAVIEVSNCITIIGELAGFQVISLPLLIAAIQIVLVGSVVNWLLLLYSRNNNRFFHIWILVFP